MNFDTLKRCCPMSGQWWGLLQQKLSYSVSDWRGLRFHSQSPSKTTPNTILLFHFHRNGYFESSSQRIPHFLHIPYQCKQSNFHKSTTIAIVYITKSSSYSKNKINQTGRHLKKQIHNLLIHKTKKDKLLCLCLLC